MNWMRVLAAMAVVLGASLVTPAWADHGHGGGHVRFGLYLGVPGPWLYPPFYGVPAYAYPVPVEMPPPQPMVYVEREPAQAPAAQSYWYYCEKPAGYWPYVEACPAGWRAVVPQPPPNAPAQR